MSAPLEQLYTRDILALAARIPMRAFRPDADFTTRVTSPVCGSELSLSVMLDDEGRVRDLGYTIRACAFGQAAMSIVAHYAPQASLEQISEAGMSVENMLKNKSTDSVLWPDFKILVPVAEVPARHRAVLLPFMAFERLGEQYRGR